MAPNSTDWLSRVVIPDLYPRRDDPYKPGAGTVPFGAPAESMVSSEQLTEVDVYSGWLTDPAQRPVVYQRAVNFQVTADVAAKPLITGQFQCDTIVLSIAAGATAYFGYGGSVTTGSGILIPGGTPIAVQPENVREPWELQRLLEAIAAMIAAERGYQPLGAFRAPRVVFNASDFYVVAAAPTNVSVMLFLVPELQ